MRIALIGSGKVGLELIRQTANSDKYQYVGVSDSTGTIIDHNGFTRDEMMGIVAYKSKGRKLENYEDGSRWFTKKMGDIFNNQVDVVVDASSHQTYYFLMEALNHGAHIVGSNKLPYADTTYRDFKKMYLTADEKGKVIDNRTVVSANLGTLVRIKEFANTAGGISYLRGGLSGTMAYISWRINEGIPFSEAVKEAIAKGYTETDFRTDLKGMDSARKAVIMARTNNYPLELSNVHVEQILPPEMESASIDDAVKMLPMLDERMESRVENAKDKRRVLKYVGELNFDESEFTVGFNEIPLHDPQASGKGSWNKVTMYPRYWNGEPLTIEGPGAGINVTTQGLMAGLYELQTNHVSKNSRQ